MSSVSGDIFSHGIFTSIRLSGTWRDMGRRYGELLGEELKAVYERTVEDALLGGRMTSRETAESVAREISSGYPYRLRELISGMAETSPLDLDQHLMLNAIEILISPSVSAESDMAVHPARNTGMAVWGEYASPLLLYGYNYESAAWMRCASQHLTLTALHPSDGSLAVVYAGLPGCVYLTAGMNENGIFASLNDGEPSGGALQYHNRVPARAQMLTFLFDAPDLEQLETCFNSAKSNRAVVVGVADDQTSRCYEWPVFDIKRRRSVRRPGLMVATNHFTEPSWGLPKPSDKSFSLTQTRRRNLLSLADHFKGSIDLAKMKKIMSTRIEDLGAATDDTIYQIIAVPGSRIFSLRVPGVSDWEDIDLAHLLQ